MSAAKTSGNTPVGLADAKVLFASLADGARAQKGLRLLNNTPPVTTIPTITLASSADAATPTQIKAATGGSASVPATINPIFTLSGGAYEQGGGAFPNYQGVRLLPLPSNPVGYGSTYADFGCDAPAMSLSFSRAQLGGSRVLVDNDDGKGLVEVLRFASLIQGATAQAGAAGTITLSSGASSTNGQYVDTWVRIVSGTGSGQSRQITAYTGSTKVATVTPNWTTTPDNTSVYEVTETQQQYTTSTQAGYSTYYFKLDWNGERRVRHYRVECSGEVFNGCYTTSSIDSVFPWPKPSGTPCVWAGDSFSAGTGSDAGGLSSLAKVCCDALGWELINVSIGGTGYLNPGTTNTAKLRDRLFPATNAWYVEQDGSTSGSFTLTQGATTTGAIQYNDTIATVQSVVDTAFGAGQFTVLGQSAAHCWLIGQGGNASVATAMTAAFSVAGGGNPYIKQWLGNLAENLPKDGNGNVLPFYLVLANGHNDTTSSNAAYTGAALQAEVTTLIQRIQATYPMATVLVVGNMYLPGGSAGSDVTTANAAISAACTATLKKINGLVPFVDTITVPWMNGTGRRGALAANGNSDLCCQTDATHPTTRGHRLYGTRLALAFQQILAGIQSLQAAG